jgi:hydroxymethyl cephem carbamoyltransferase
LDILSVKPGHDGAIAFVSDGELIFSLEAEKDSFQRYEKVTANLLIDALEMAPAQPDVIALGGWNKKLPGSSSGIGAGYLGIDKVDLVDSRVFGRAVKLFSSSHERSHLYMATVMYPGAPIDECVILVWEGRIGAFYHWRHGGRSITRYPVLSEPGNRYSALFALSEPSHPDFNGRNPDYEYAGKMLALTAFDDGRSPSDDDRAVVERLLQEKPFFPFDKKAYADSGLYNCGVTAPRFQAAARYMTDRLFEEFLRVAVEQMPHGLPLLISGGCGLNCNWNQRWRASSLFSEVFVPPCTNDSGSAIGTAADAMLHLGEPCRLVWSVYAGMPFVRDVEPNGHAWSRHRADPDRLAARLHAGAVLPWVRGRCEIGPRALGNRSLLSSPLDASSRETLNYLMEREDSRPIAPSCVSEELDRWFEPAIDDPYMLYFSRVKTDCLPAITHADGTARVQSVSRDVNPAFYEPLSKFGSRTDYGVLCNTSLNFKGFGFRNRMSDLLHYCDVKPLDDFVVDDDWFQRSSATELDR